MKVYLNQRAKVTLSVPMTQFVNFLQSLQYRKDLMIHVIETYIEE